MSNQNPNISGRQFQVLTAKDARSLRHGVDDLLSNASQTKNSDIMRTSVPWSYKNFRRLHDVPNGQVS